MAAVSRQGGRGAAVSDRRPSKPRSPLRPNPSGRSNTPAPAVDIRNHKLGRWPAGLSAQGPLTAKSPFQKALSRSHRRDRPCRSGRLSLLGFAHSSRCIEPFPFDIHEIINPSDSHISIKIWSYCCDLFIAKENSVGSELLQIFKLRCLRILNPDELQ